MQPVHPLQPLVLALILCTVAPARAEQTIGGGTVDQPAAGPAPTYDYGVGKTGFVLVKNWDFGTDGDSTITNMSEMSQHFQYHDQFGTFANGTKYGAYTVAPDSANARNYGGVAQPIEGVNTDRPVREFTSESLKTYLVGLDGADKVHPKEQKAGCGSFQAKWTLPAGGSRLGRDMLWETRVRYKTPPYFWFAIWTAGNKWDRGAEFDLVESFGWDNTNKGGGTNYDGRYWHSSSVGGQSETNYHANWGAGMRKYGFTDFDASEWHTWALLHRADDTFVFYLDGKPVQRGKAHWTVGTDPKGEPIDVSFIFDGGWGHREVSSVNHWMPVSEFEGKFYEWDYSRVYLSAKER